MEVHPPHEPVHSWRDALIHIGLMTVGLFIALMLEGFVEYLHHKELVHEARENVRRELERNHEAAKQNIADLDKEAERVQAGMDTLTRMYEHPRSHGSISFSWNYVSLGDAAWRSARDTGALGFMPYEQVEDLADLYGNQAHLTERIQDLQLHQMEVIAPMATVKDNDALPKDKYDLMMTDAARTAFDLQILGQYLKNLDQQYTAELKKL